MQYLLLILGLFLSVIAILKDYRFSPIQTGRKNIGWVLLVLIMITFAGNAYLTHTQDQQQVSIEQETEEFRKHSAQFQSYLAASFLDPKQPFTHAILSFSFFRGFDSEAGFANLLPDDSSEHFPFISASNPNVIIDLSITGLDSTYQTYGFTFSENGKYLVEQRSQDVSKRQGPFDFEALHQKQMNEMDGNRTFNLMVDTPSQRTFSGEHSDISTFIQFGSNDPAIMTFSKVIDNPYIGTIRFLDTKRNANIDRWMQKVSAELYFLQPSQYNTDKCILEFGFEVSLEHIQNEETGNDLVYQFVVQHPAIFSACRS